MTSLTTIFQSREMVFVESVPNNVLSQIASTEVYDVIRN